MTRQEIVNDIISKIKQNGNREITGVLLQGVLLNMINSAGLLGIDAGLRDYDPARTYKPADCAVFNGQIFRCSEQTSGAFEADKWQVISLMPVVQTINERDSLFYRFEGMQCYVLDTHTFYSLIGGIGNENWQQPQQPEVHTYYFQPEVNGQQTFTIPDRVVLYMTVNGVAYGPDDYQLSNGNGQTRQLTWINIDCFGLDTTDTLCIVYTGSLAN